MHTDTETGVRTEVAAVIPRITELIAALPDPWAPVAGSRLCAREVAVHLIVTANLYGEIATGTPSPLHDASPRACASLFNGLQADIPEADPARLAGLVANRLHHVLGVTAGHHGGERVAFHLARELPLDALLGLLLGEVLLHGADLAVLAGQPWPIEPHHSAIITAAYADAGAGTSPRARPATARSLLALRRTCPDLDAGCGSVPPEPTDGE